MSIPRTIPYQGSKRSLAQHILSFFPDSFYQLIEPFAGSAAISIASASHLKANRFILNDINKPLVHLLEMIVHNPAFISQSYHYSWHQQLKNPEHYYNWLRKRFNATQQPEDLLFLLSRCVKSAVRYNAHGQFNQSSDKRFLGKNPKWMHNDLMRIAELLKGKIQCYAEDYQCILPLATENDLVYLDPPYQGTGITGGFSYVGKVNSKEFVQALQKLNNRNIPYILSFNGRTGNKTFGKPLPKSLELMKLEINAGRSSQATLLHRLETTYEALYLSPALIHKIDLQKILHKKTSILNPMWDNYDMVNIA
jgi:DNA adenine methylase